MMMVYMTSSMLVFGCVCGHVQYSSEDYNENPLILSINEPTNFMQFFAFNFKKG